MSSYHAQITTTSQYQTLQLTQTFKQAAITYLTDEHFSSIINKHGALLHNIFKLAEARDVVGAIAAAPFSGVIGMLFEQLSEDLCGRMQFGVGGIVAGVHHVMDAKKIYCYVRTRSVKALIYHSNPLPHFALPTVFFSNLKKCFDM